eukprot:TRINITY_DN2910_c0_g1_i1.p1 TRINITY_DN2910_c0_g1~~TRINITY_DN2910_c0_g1_i1.p1  ORF type:complete len:346 (-),score=134.05 TRINITY_DN2910_c0_g1_i1:120-1064(-)
MARNSEKAQAMLNRWVQAQKDMSKPEEKKRPYLATLVTDLGEATKFYHQIVREIQKSVSIIQNGSLGEHRIRDLNDAINKLLRERRHWARQVKQLGGPDYETESIRIQDVDGKKALGASGYFYFGAAKNLPGVRELFDQAAAEDLPRVTRGELHKLIDSSYYGYRDEDDGLLVKLEAKQEALFRAKAIEKWKRKQGDHSLTIASASSTSTSFSSSISSSSSASLSTASKKDAWMDMEDDDDDKDVTMSASASSSSTLSSSTLPSSSSASSEDIMKAYVSVPSQEEMTKLVLEQRRKQLLAKFGAPSSSSSSSSS